MHPTMPLFHELGRLLLVDKRIQAESGSEFTLEVLNHLENVLGARPSEHTLDTCQWLLSSHCDDLSTS